MRLSRRVLDTPPYLFHLIDQKRKAAQEKGIDVVSLAIGDPDQPTPQFVLDLMAEEIRDPRNHVYPGYKGEPDFCESVARWFGTRFGVELDPRTEIMATIGAKDRGFPSSLCLPGSGRLGHCDRSGLSRIRSRDRICRRVDTPDSVAGRKRVSARSGCHRSPDGG